MSQKYYLVGAAFNRLTVLEKVGAKLNNSGRSRIIWKCKCICGRVVEANTTSLLSGVTQSCGCLKRDRTIAKNTKHGGSRRIIPHDRAYNIWNKMRSRCENPNSPDFNDYGRRGIVVCERWSEYANFISDMGHPAKDQSIDRIDNDGGYSPGNCRWADAKTQARNSRHNRLLTHCGVTFPASVWAEKVGLPYKTMMARIYSGWTVDRAISEPLRIY